MINMTIAHQSDTTRHLILTFEAALKLIAENPRSSHTAWGFNTQPVEQAAEQFTPLPDDDEPWWQGAAAQSYLSEVLIPALEQTAPETHPFGVRDGDYGFWKE